MRMKMRRREAWSKLILWAASQQQAGVVVMMVLMAMLMVMVVMVVTMRMRRREAWSKLMLQQQQAGVVVVAPRAPTACLTWVALNYPLPCSFLHSFEMVAMFISYDFDIENSMSHLGGQLYLSCSFLHSFEMVVNCHFCWPSLSALTLILMTTFP